MIQKVDLDLLKKKLNIQNILQPFRRRKNEIYKILNYVMQIDFLDRQLKKLKKMLGNHLK